jgi:hypothetical protein
LDLERRKDRAREGGDMESDNDEDSEGWTHDDEPMDDDGLNERLSESEDGSNGDKVESDTESDLDNDGLEEFQSDSDLDPEEDHYGNNELGAEDGEGAEEFELLGYANL